jgi:diguanylate cyclase (GGDEF)-like protein
MVTQGVVPLVLILCSLAYVARVFSFETLGVEWGALFLVALFATLAAKSALVLTKKRQFEDDLLLGLLLVLAVKALGQALAWGVCGVGASSCAESVQGLEFLAFAFLAVYHGPLSMAGFALYAALLQLGHVGGPSVLHAAAEPEVIKAGLPGVAARFLYDLAFGVGFGFFVRNERVGRQDVEEELNRIAREAKSFRLEEVVATPDAGLEAMSRAGREDAEMRAVTRLREKEANIARFLKQSLLCYSAVIFRFDPVTKKLELRAYRSDSRNIRDGAAVNPGEGVIGWVFNKREQLTAGNNFKPIPDLPYYSKEDEGVLSLLGYPIIDPETDRALGVLAIDSREMDVLKEQHFSTLEMAARMLVEAVRNEESRSRQETEALQLQAMLEISRQMSEELNVEEICKRVILSVFRIVPYEVASVVLWDAEKKIFRVEYAARADGAPVEAADWMGAEFAEEAESAATLAMRQDAPLLMANYRDRDKSKRLPLWGGAAKLPDVDSVLAVPLKRAGESVGCIVLGAKGKDVFEETERRLFGILASLIAASLLNAQKHRATEERATTDALTGLANRIKFKEFYAQQAAISKRSKQPLSLLIMDLDHFKKVNDTYGHPAGDAVLKQMAEILKKQCRETDLPTRYGGEEFVAVLVNTTRKDAVRMAERIRKAVAGHAFELPDGRTIKCTLSIGAATFPDDTKREDELTEKADKALYGAKANGRNRVQQYADLPEREGTTSWSEVAPQPVPTPEKEPAGETTVAGSKSWRF